METMRLELQCVFPAPLGAKYKSTTPCCNVLIGKLNIS